MRPLFPLALVCLALCFALVVPAQAANSFSSAGEVGQWIMDYYKKPEPERLADALKVLAESDGISEDGQKLIVSFVGAALAEAPKAQEGFFKAVQDHEKARLFAIPAFWFMNNAEGKALIERAGKQWKGTGVSELAKQLLASQSPNLMAGSVRTSLHLDHLWSVFFATGNAE
ncbi:MAG: hypothetical protein KKC99_06235, partial [Proteobacteria bacterium]|nr:hypothetical protein [Pseudomonadota bacterium]